jgi:hypothetical protein
MDTIHIEIKGMGTTFDYEIHIIEKALKENGLNVSIENPHPHPEKYTQEDLDKLKKYSGSRKAVITCKHVPWGG